MRHQISGSALLVATLGLFSGCKTVLQGDKQPIVFETTPAGAQVRVDNAYIGSTPVTFAMPRAGSHRQVRMTLDGYKTEAFTLMRSTQDPDLFTIVFMPGAMVDDITGASGQYSDHIHINLQRGWGMNLRDEAEVVVGENNFGGAE